MDDDRNINDTVMQAIDDHVQSLASILLTVFDLPITRVIKIAEIQKKRFLSDHAALLNECPAYWLVDVIMNEDIRREMDWNILDDVRQEFADAFHKGTCVDTLDSSYDWISARERCKEIIARYGLKLNLTSN